MITVQEKVLKYLQEHKTPTQAVKIARYFIISESSVRNALKELMDAGALSMDKKGAKKFYRLK